ncbi:MAG: PQQ-binding-like beta-propeller repeat protein [Verrucomicrobiota bacterium]
MKHPFLIAGLCLASAAGAAEISWPEFRGPNQDGTVDSPLPTEWSEETVTWKTPIHGLGWSTPLIGEGKIWVTTATEDGTQLSALCIDVATGEIIADRVFITVDNPEPLANPINTYASSTGVLERGRVFLHWGSYGTICLDTASFEILWQRRDLTCSHWRGAASSLVDWKDTVILTMEGADQQYFVALDKDTGETLWRRDRETQFDDEKDGIPANSGDMRKAYSTPIFVSVGGTTHMICNGAKAAWAYNPDTGEPIWSVRYPTHSPSSRSVYSPETGLVYINTGLGKAEVWAVRLDPESRGDITESHVEWKQLKRTPKRSSPVLAGGLLFWVNDGVASCVDPATGEKLWAERAGGDYSASMLTDGQNVYAFDEEGLCTVLKAEKSYEVVAENHLDAGFMASPAVTGSSLILRTRTHLYRVD